MKTITQEEIRIAINIMKNDWETHKDIKFVKAMCNHLTHEITKLEKSEKADN